MGRLGEDRCGLAVLDNATEVHDGDFMGQILDDPQVMRDEEIGELITCLEVTEQVQDLGLHRDIQRTSGFIEIKLKSVDARSRRAQWPGAGAAYQKTRGHSAAA
jgi:hypothetical protein